MVRLLSIGVVLVAMALSACSAFSPLASPTPLPQATTTSPPMEIRCIMAEHDQAILLVTRSSPAAVDQAAIKGNCVANGRLGPTWAPIPLTTPLDGYKLVCQGPLTTQATNSIMVRESDTYAAGRAYDGCHAIPNATYPAQ